MGSKQPAGAAAAAAASLTLTFLDNEARALYQIEPCFFS